MIDDSKYVINALHNECKKKMNGIDENTGECSIDVDESSVFTTPADAQRW